MSDPSEPASPSPRPPPPALAPPPPPPASFQPGSMPPPITPTARGGIGAAGIISQFTGVAAVGCLFGVATVLAPIVFGWVFYVLPVAGLLAGVQAVRRGQLIGGIVAIVLNVIGGMLTLVGVLG